MSHGYAFGHELRTQEMMMLVPGGAEMGTLVGYKLACRIIAQIARVDDLKDIIDTTVAMKAYAKQAKDRQLEANAIAIRMRATRRLDQLRQAQKQTVGLNRGAAGGGKRSGLRGVLKTPRDVRPTLASQGIDKNLAKEARRLGALSQRDFESQVQEEREKVALRPTKLSIVKPAAFDPIARCIKTVKRAIAVASKKVPRERVLRALWKEIGVPEDCGPGSAGELARKDAYIEQLENEVRQLKSKRGT